MQTPDSMQVVLVDPYFLDGDSPPNWALGQIEAILTERGCRVRAVDFVHRGEEIRTLTAFHALEAEFITRVADAAGDADAVYITTSLVVPQKPMPVFTRLERMLRRLRERAPHAMVVVGGAQVQYLNAQGIDPYSVIDAQGVAGFLVDRETAFCNLPATHRAGTDLRGIPGARCWTAAGSPAPLAGGGPSEPVRFATWSGWDLSAYPEYRAVLTSVGCRYGCSFCFESKQEFASFGFLSVLQPYLEAGQRVLAVEDSTVLGAHGLQRVLDAAPYLPDDFRYSAYALVNEVVRASEGDLRRLSDKGLYTVILGIETPDHETLKKYRKSVVPDKVRAALLRLRDAGIRPQGCVMLGIPEVTRDATWETIDYCLELTLDIRRWHVFQPDFVNPPPGLGTPEPLDVRRFARIEVNLPDALLPEALASAPQEAFLEEHALIRALPYLRTAPDVLRRFTYSAGYTLHDLYTALLARLPGTKDSFSEEHAYRAITPDHPRAARIFDQDASLAGGLA